MFYSTYLLLVLVSVLLLGCAEHTGTDLSVSANSSSNMQLSPPPILISSRKIDTESLFAEVSISYSDVFTSITADKDPNTDFWAAQLQVPTQTAFSISVTWFDRLDQQRLDLVTSTRSYQPINFPGEFSITNNFTNYDSDNFDADSDSIVNLTERLNGTSPFDPTSPSNDPPLSDPLYVFVNSANGAVDEISDDGDTLPVSVVQTVPGLNSAVPSSVNTPITLFFDDKLLFDSLPGNTSVLENNQPIGGTVTISESSNGFAILTFSPNRPYQDGVTVTLRFTGGENGVRDDAGNPLVGNVGDDFVISITTIDQGSDTFDNNFSFESSNQGVVFTGDGAVLGGTLGCLSANAGNNFAAISTGQSIVSNGSAVEDTSSTIQIGPIGVGNGSTSISFDYNFVSEEFPFFIGSSFDDSAVISISGPNGTFAGVLTTVNTVGAEGFSACDGIPNISSGSGQTGWLNRTIDFGNIGSPIVMTFTVTDVADDTFSSILAVDNFRF